MTSATTTAASQADLDALAAFLLKRRDAILAEWRDRLELDAESSVTARLTRAEFFDHVPRFLNALHARLRRPEGPPDGHAGEAAADHGAHRWQQGFNLLEVTREWGHLHRTLLQELESFAAAHPRVSPQTSFAARDRVAELIHDGVSRSVAEYHRLQRVEAEARARDLERLLSRHVEQGRVRGESLRAASHDLKGGLSIIWTAAEVLAGGSDDAERAEMVGLIRSAAAELGAMLSDLLDLSRLEAGLEERRVEPFDAAELLRELCRTSAPLADAGGLRLSGSGPVSLAVRGDRLKVRRVAQNLVLNALKYTREGGVEVRWQAEPHDRWSFAVRDTGPGLPAGTAAPLVEEIEAATDEAREIGSDAPTEREP
ncbi:MAG TPA: sensor histidine kinase, partial [Planctomycetaceae bacterium]